MPSISNNLILVKGQDKTEKIVSWHFEKGKNVVWINYGRKDYPYNTRDVVFLKNPQVIDVSSKVLLKSDEVCYNAKTVQFFDCYARIIYNRGDYEICSKNSIKIVSSILEEKNSDDRFQYFVDIAREIGLKDEQGVNILANRYKKIDFIREDGVLADILRGEIREEIRESDNPILFPFGLNLSQKDAVENALKHKISVIEGPPGTGKTQTILNIIANVIMENKTIAVISNSNSAISNILDKLKRADVDFIAAYLGNIENKKTFVENQKDIPDILTWGMSDDDFRKSIMTLKTDESTFNEKLKLQNRHAEIAEELNKVSIEYEHFIKHSNLKEGVIFSFSKNISSKKILEFLAEYELIKKEGQSITFLKKITCRLKYGIKLMSVLNEKYELIYSRCMIDYYEKRICELKDDLKRVEKQLNNFNLDEQISNFLTVSMKIFKGKLYKKYANLTSRKTYNLTDIWTKSNEFIKEYPVVLSTAYSLVTSLNNRYLCDYVIVDEASQVDLATGILGLSCAKNAVIVGDSKQLPNVISNETKEKTIKIFEQYQIPNTYKYDNHSLLTFIKELFVDVPTVLLKEHYRCNPTIIGFCNQRFYNNDLLIMTNENGNTKPFEIYKTVKGNHVRNHVNQRQIDVIVNEIMPNLGSEIDRNTIGVIAPYRNQVDSLKKVFKGTNVQVDTVDKFQGRERDIIIFCTVDNEISEFVSNPNRLNVAISRAKNRFILVTDGNENDIKSPINDLIGYIIYNNCEIIESKIKSIFDYLYGDYREAREKILKKYGRLAEWDSENLMYGLLRDILKEEKYSTFDVVLHVPLNHLINNYSILSQREIQYARNPNTHLDFLIYSRLTHLPVMAIEVDGYFYHDMNDKQLDRDQLKNSVLEKIGIPLVRCKTIESREEERIREKLEKLVI